MLRCSQVGGLEGGVGGGGGSTGGVVIFREGMRGSNEVEEGFQRCIYLYKYIYVHIHFSPLTQRHDALQAQKAELACQVGVGDGGGVWGVRVGVRNTGREIDRWKIGGE